MSPVEPHVEWHIVAHGRVQGVGFRATVQYHANRLNLVGTVRNLPEGSVEIFVVGPLPAIQSLIHSLQKAFGDGYIAELKTKEISPQNSYQDFRVLH